MARVIGKNKLIRILIDYVTIYGRTTQRTNCNALEGVYHLMQSSHIKTTATKLLIGRYFRQATVITL